MSTIMKLVRPKPGVKHAIFYSFGEGGYNEDHEYFGCKAEI